MMDIQSILAHLGCASYDGSTNEADASNAAADTDHTDCWGGEPVTSSNFDLVAADDLLCVESTGADPCGAEGATPFESAEDDVGSDDGAETASHATEESDEYGEPVVDHTKSEDTRHGDAEPTENDSDSDSHANADTDTEDEMDGDVDVSVGANAED